VNSPPRIRVDGELLPVEHPALTADETRRLATSVLSSDQIAKLDRELEIDCSFGLEGSGRFRANVFHQQGAVASVMRSIPNSIPDFDRLGMPRQVCEMICNKHAGLVLVTGVTGSGKSTSLAAMIDYINSHHQGHIVTIEDPVEFVHENQKCLINQREVHTHTDSFKNALRAALREDPDIVLVGEMRDLETVAIAIETAETGHLVFGTLHTTTAASTVDRIVDQFPTDRQAQIRIMLSESLKGVIAQNLCRKIGGGRAAALEVLIATQAVSNLIRESKTFQIPSIMQVGKAVGMVTLNDSLMDLVTKKVVAPDEAYSKSVDKGGFEMLLKRANITLDVKPKAYSAAATPGAPAAPAAPVPAAK
jgi:twitching motility protein PilT